MIEVKNLAKVFVLTKKQQKEQGTKETEKRAVNGLSFCVKPGEIYGLLGPNGAGKTTTLRCISTLISPTEGEASVCGFDTVREAEKVRGQIGFLTNEIKLDPQFSPEYLFSFFGGLHGMTEEQVKKRQDELFSQFGIYEFKDKKIGELSTGMKQKASIAVSLVHDPKVVIFDEPTNGLDIITARAVTDYLKLLRDQGKVVLVSTHIMSEAEKLCDRIGIVMDGKKVLEGTKEEILSKTDSRDLEDAFFVLYKRIKGENE